MASSLAPQSSRRPLWLRLILVAVSTGACGVLTLIGLVLGLAVLWQQAWFQTWVFQLQMRGQLSAAAEPPAVSERPYQGPILSAAGLAGAEALFQPAQVWEAHLHFTAGEWERLGPNRVTPIHNWRLPDGSPILRNPNASRHGIAGVLGFDLPWSSATAFEFGGVRFTNIAARYKGNGTFLAGLHSYRRPFKLDLNKRAADQALAGRTTLNLHNLEADRSFLSDTLGYEFFREAGVKAPRTTFVRLFLTLEGRWERRLLGPYLVVENPDAEWVKAEFGRDDVALFKPVTRELFEDLGDAWEVYEEVYDPKTKPTEAQQRRLMELCKLVSHAGDAEFARRIGEYVDLEQFARFLACVSLTSSYDSILDNGQNYLLWLDAASNRFGFSPWDLDHSWGEFPWVGSATDRERARLFHPWLGPKRFFERIFAVETFRERYRAELERLLGTLFVPDRLHRRIDVLAEAIRPAVAEMSLERLDEFERAVAATGEAEGGTVEDASHRRRRGGVHQLKRFIAARAVEARAQLDGRSEGVLVTRNGRP